jgi:hypothetical protein
MHPASHPSFLSSEGKKERRNWTARAETSIIKVMEEILPSFL